ncbi:hypothetical protein Francci3_3326 [Frankia casuarinae]|uniref:Uncharacterized protein n=1 Tax=Frankia casuarinae (strain DSM 45818 / CECT 9043 / HFP020203 / CcI3) TaxID=106370 RepID=Q2J7Q9_FRACC|nr:hypothetical protein Francci3_3326 [Frankia casuarinae]
MEIAAGAVGWRGPTVTPKTVDGRYASPTGGAGGLTIRELARRYGVAVSTVGTAMTRGARDGHPAPNPLDAAGRASGARHFHPEAFDRWWSSRPHTHRPRRRRSSDRPPRRVVDVLPDLSAWQPADPDHACQSHPR